MTNEKAILIDIANSLESLGTAVDAIEAILIRTKACSSAEFASEKSLHVSAVRSKMELLWTAIGTMV